MLPINPHLEVPLLAQLIQLSIAPVFLLTAIGAFLSAITTRLGRVIDRARALETIIASEGVENNDTALAELASLDRRMLLANRAVALSVSSALTVCALIIVLFVSAVSPIHLEQVVPILFILALLLLTASLTAFALEIRISIRTVRVRAELIRHMPQPRFPFPR
ncbi:DUF2721 domain-containing protein [Sandaracinobacter sp. RS1-74]|uniref:DUF2721 domain-containing protein n=1 Tax=Sandaracinobacteroides sayramensis TaxID=2913411 RepID=UPI001EDA5C38|nr:DUF2721 domain-containing protein [Sandaracinobacteroides sayramensis]MCG2841839.1 DUF2721 domain-containing protein [Sandaracinobacteroides sayramensis]